MFSKSLTAVLFLTASIMFGALIPVDEVPLSGTGLGSQFTLVTFQETGTESGCVAGAAGGGAITGSTACPSGVCRWRRTGHQQRIHHNGYRVR